MSSTRTGSGEKRFPFAGYPRGWFAVGFSDELAAGEVRRVRYFGEDLVLFRTESGRAQVSGSTCPHLGANLGVGGEVVGETLKCPFHGWRFEADGPCAEVPYAPKIPPRARLEVWPTRERGGVIFAHYGDAEAAPFPALDDEGLTPPRTVFWGGLATHPQEVFENTVDLAHIGPVHDGRAAQLLAPPDRDGDRMTVELAFDAPGDVVGMPGTTNHVELRVTMHGLGHVVVDTTVTTAGVRARQQIYATPIDEGHIDLRGVVQVVPHDDAAFTEELARIYYDAYVEDFAKDFPIWENKRYLPRPLLAKGDGPIGLYRRWCRGLYPAEAEEVDVPVARLKDTLLQRAAAAVRGPIEKGGAVLSSLARAAGRSHGTSPDARPEAPPTTKASATPTTAARPEPSPAPASATQPVEDVEEYIATLPRRFVPTAAQGVDAVFQWQLLGDGGATFHAVVDGGEVEVVRTSHPSPTVTLEMAAADYVRVVNGELDGMRAFASGRGKVRGSIRAAMSMERLFPR